MALSWDPGLRLECDILTPYPRSDVLRRIMRRVEETGGSDTLELQLRLLLDTQFLIGVQVGSGAYSVADPWLEAHDILRPFIEAWRGVHIDGLERWFDNNFFYRVPVFTEMPDIQRLVLAPRAALLRRLIPLDKPVRVVLPGPLTIVKLSKHPGLEEEKLAERIAEILSREVRAAVEAGASIVEIHEPILASTEITPDDAVFEVRLLERMLSGLKVEKRLATYYQPVQPEVWAKLVDVPVDLIIVDYVDNPRLAEECLRRRKPNAIGLGLVNARNIYMEEPSEVRRKAEEIASKTGLERLLVTTSAPLDLIPFKHAVEKTVVTCTVCRVS